MTRVLRQCTPKQRTWLRALPDNDYQRWKTAGALGYSKKTIHKWLRIEHVQKALELQQQIAIDELDITNRRILREYSRIAFSSPKALFKEDGTLKAMHELDDDTAASVQSINFEEISADGRTIGRIAKFRQHEKRAALEALANFTKVVVPRIEVTGKNGGAIETKAEHSDKDIARRVAFLLSKGLRAKAQPAPADSGTSTSNSTSNGDE